MHAAHSGHWTMVACTTADLFQNMLFAAQAHTDTPESTNVAGCTDVV
jgi:hypothetical protein